MWFFSASFGAAAIWVGPTALRVRSESGERQFDTVSGSGIAFLNWRFNLGSLVLRATPVLHDGFLDFRAVVDVLWVIPPVRFDVGRLVAPGQPSDHFPTVTALHCSKRRAFVQYHAWDAVAGIRKEGIFAEGVALDDGRGVLWLLIGQWQGILDARLQVVVVRSSLVVLVFGLSVHGSERRAFSGHGVCAEHERLLVLS